MNALIANTDFEWYRFLHERKPDEVNFWQPSAHRGFRALRPGEPLIFKLKKDRGNAIVGFGLFVMFHRMSAWQAWNVFGENNGASSRQSMWNRLRGYASGATSASLHEIGCILLSTPVYFDQDLWIDGPRDWKPQIVSGKGYSTDSGEGKRIWNECLARMPFAVGENTRDYINQVSEENNRFGKIQTVLPRLGQGTFRLAVQTVYGRCAVTGEHTLPALEAAHIVPYTENGPHEVPNGLFLRADIHKLFDAGYVTVTPDYTFRVSQALDEEFHNGKDYYKRDGKRIWLPADRVDFPDRDRLAWHGAEKFRAT